MSKETHPKIVQERLGHSNIIQTMDTYSHVVSDMQDEAVSVMKSTLSSYYFKILARAIPIVVRNVGDSIPNGEQSCTVVEAYVDGVVQAALPPAATGLRVGSTGQDR